MSTSSSALREMRRARRTRRLGGLEWFEIAYRVYLAALFGGLAVMWLSDLVTDEAATADQLADVVERGPAVIGLFAVAAVALGLRSGSDGGPISLEAGDARHLMLAPIPRREVLLRPVGQRMRSIAFASAVSGAIAGQLASRRLPGSAAAWAASGAAAAALAGLAFVAVAVIVHALGLPRWAATSLAMLLLALQGAAVAWGWPGPGDHLGSLAMWGMRRQPADLIAVVVILVAAGVALVIADRLRLEQLTRRADLVSQLRFAVTVQDLRTVVLLRRQLRGERPRTMPWIVLGRSPANAGATRAVIRRGLRGLARYPSSRLARMAALAALAGFAIVAVLRGTTPAVLAAGFALYLLGLDAIEPLSQEIDHPDVADGVPQQRGWLLLRHLGAPIAGLVPFAVIGAGAVSVAEPSAAAAAFALALPVTLAGACGSVVSVVRDAADPLSASSAAVPPEFAGASSFIRMAVPIVISTIPTLTALAMREFPEVGTAVRMAVLNALLIAATAWWVRKGDEWRAKLRAFSEAGRRAS
ncbi:MAG: hypothetical protein K0S92_639 [Desertimonas sp.]|nr:hypothetical protein [Desertimonas sp.]